MILVFNKGGQQNKHAGVTLIELLIVMTIMMTMLALVSPLAIDSVEKAQAQSEYLSLAGWMQKASTKAFSNGMGINVELKEHQLIASLPSGKQVVKEFDFLFFSPSEFKFTRNGLPSLISIKIKVRNQYKELNLIDLLERKSG